MIRKLLIVCVLALCAAIYVAELSGHRDQRIQDTNDEATVAAIVLCAGAALLVAGGASPPPPTRPPRVAVPARDHPRAWWRPRSRRSHHRASRRIGRAFLFVNGENLTNVKQTDWDPLLRPSRGVDGRWTVDAWAPLDGRVINGGIRLAF